MHTLSVVDPGQSIDWGRTSRDYALYRPGPPDTFYRRLAALEVGLAGQRILDLGTGTGVLARRFAAQGAHVAGLDLAPEQIEAARALAERDELDVDFRVGSAEELPFDDAAFDVVTANQCWLYFDLGRTIPEVQRVLGPGGVLVTSHFSFLPRLDPVARASEQLVLRYNPAWSASDWSGRIPARPGWSRADFIVRAMFFYDEPIPFTRESWRGRMRALRGVGASLDAERVHAFDAEHERLLEGMVSEHFAVLHRIDAHIFQPRAALPEARIHAAPEGGSRSGA